MFEKIRYYYEKGLYKTAHLDKLLAVGAISRAEYESLKGGDKDE